MNSELKVEQATLVTTKAEMNALRRLTEKVSLTHVVALNDWVKVFRHFDTLCSIKLAILEPNVIHFEKMSPLLT